MTSVLALLGVFFVAIAFQALFAGYETGFVSANTIRIRYLAEDEGNARARGLLHYIEQPEQMLVMLLIGTNIATIAGTMAVTQEFNMLLGARASGVEHAVSVARWSELAAMIFVTPLLLVFGEILPKSVFRAHPNRLTLALFPIINTFYWVMAPAAKPVAWLTQTLFRRRDRRSYLSPLMSTPEDVRVLVDESAQHGTIDAEEQRMIHAIFDLQNMLAKEIMVPRIDITALPDTTTRADLLATFEASGRTRIPIYRESIDQIVGAVTAHDILLATRSDSEGIRPLIRDIMHVPDTITLGDVFEEMKRKKQHIAIVIDEYGGTDGLITLEDILEVIFGQIQDEHDRELRPIQRVGPDAYVIDGRMNLEEAAEFMEVVIEDDEVETVGGWLMHVAGRIPTQGEVIMHNGFRVIVLEGGLNHISRLRLEILPEARETYGIQTNETKANRRHGPTVS